MEGKYHFIWSAVAATGVIEGRYEQTIYGKNLQGAAAYFTLYHGDLSPDENGTCLVINSIVWQPL